MYKGASVLVGNVDSVKSHFIMLGELVRKPENVRFKYIQ